ncbi:MAG: PIN domain-containing protein [Acidimicrobiia bacterium]
MTRLLLDTTFLIDAERSGTGVDRAIGDDDDVAIAAVTIAELRVGTLLASRARKPARHAYIEEVIAAVPVLAYDAGVAEIHAELLAEVRKQGRPRGAHDLIIAATAKTFGRTIVSADRTAFEGLSGIEVRATG